MHLWKSKIILLLVESAHLNLVIWENCNENVAYVTDTQSIEDSTLVLFKCFIAIGKFYKYVHPVKYVYTHL